ILLALRSGAAGRSLGGADGSALPVDADQARLAVVVARVRTGCALGAGTPRRNGAVRRAAYRPRAVGSSLEGDPGALLLEPTALRTGCEERIAGVCPALAVVRTRALVRAATSALAGLAHQVTEAVAAPRLECDDRALESLRPQRSADLSAGSGDRTDEPD